MVKLAEGCLRLSPRVMLIYLTATNLLIYLDRGALSSVISILKTDDQGLDLNSGEAGGLGSIFMLGYMIASPIFAHFAQQTHPIYLMGFGLMIWSIATFLAGMSTTFGWLLTARAFTGVGEASFVSLAPPYIMEIAPENSKSIWLAVFYSGLSIGNASGFVYGGLLSSIFHSWRWPFIIESFIMIPFIIIAFSIHKDPKYVVRKENKQKLITETSEEIVFRPSTVPLHRQFRDLFLNKIFLLLVLGYSSFAFTLGGLVFWAPDFIQEDYHIADFEAVLLLGALFMASGLSGLVMGSYLLDKKMLKYTESYNKHLISEDELERFRTYEANRILAIVTILGSSIAVIGVLIDKLVPFLICVTIGEFFCLMGTGPIGISLMSCVPKELRGQANAVSVFVLHLFGDFPSPYLIGLTSDRVSIHFAMLILTLWLGIACIFWSIAWARKKALYEKSIIFAQISHPLGVSDIDVEL